MKLLQSDITGEDDEAYEDRVTHEYEVAYQKFNSLLEDNDLKEWLTNLLNSHSSSSFTLLFIESRITL